jgi:hypothetical protein
VLAKHAGGGLECAAMTEAPLLKHTDVLRERLPLRGAWVADVGAQQPARARAAEPADGRLAVEAAEASLRQAFLAAAEQRDGGFCFEIPSRLNLLRPN